VEGRKKIKSHLLFFPFLNHTESFAERTYKHDENLPWRIRPVGKRNGYCWKSGGCKTSYPSTRV